MAVLAMCGAACRSTPATTPPTFARDIAPIVYANCVSCHRPGQIAPFSLLTYDEVRDHAAQIVRAVESREMPPWLPEPGVGTFANARGLSAGEIANIRRWTELGLLRGDATVPPPPADAAATWQLGKPDLVVTLPAPYTLRAGDGDVFRNFVVPVNLSRPVFVRGVEFQPGHAASVHHAVIGVDGTGESRRLDAADPEPGYEGMFSDDFHSPDGHFVGWTPGRTASFDQPDMAWRLEPGTDLVVQLHMLPGESPVALQPAIGLYFSDTPPSRVPFMVKLTSTTIDIPAGATQYVVEDAYTLPVDVEAVSVYPHAHFLGREIRATATLPSGQAVPLLLIRNWDFHWQEFYRYAAPVALPRGTTVSMRITYDNSSAHQPKPGQQPRRVQYGPRSSDEMGDLWLQVLPSRPDDLPALARDFIARRAQSRLAAAEASVAQSPADAALRDLLGTRYLAAGRLDDAIGAFREALRLKPGYTEAENNLGAALVEAGRAREALAPLRAAERTRPGDGRVLFNLGNALRDSGQADAATQTFERALAVTPDSAELLNNLAALDGARGNLTRAVERLTRALALREDYPEAHHNLALALAAMGRLDDARSHARRALELRPDFTAARQTLADLERR